MAGLAVGGFGPCGDVGRVSVGLVPGVVGSGELGWLTKAAECRPPGTTAYATPPAISKPAISTPRTSFFDMPVGGRRTVNSTAPVVRISGFDM